MTRDWTILTRGLIALALASTSGCSLLVDSEANQCESTSDCLSKGGDFASAICSPSKVCVPLQTKDCLHVFPDDVPLRDDTLVVGFMSPLVGDFASNGVPQWEGVQLAINELYQGSIGLPLPDGSKRDIVVVGCHDFDDPLGVARHLVDDVGVPAILGPAFSGITLDVATNVTVPGGALLFASSATSAAITQLNDKGLVWRTSPSDAIQAVPLAGLVGDMETKIRNDQALSPSTQIKVAITVKGDAYGLGLADAVVPLLKFNGKSASANGANLLRKDYPDPAQEPSFEFLPMVSDVIKFTPNIVIAIGTNESITEVMQQLESQWPGALPKPIYLFADGGRLEELSAAATQNADLRKRVLGTAPGRKTANFSDWANRFNGFHGHQPLTYADSAYDSAYLLAFAIGWLGNEPITGAGLNEGLKQMIGGIEVVPGVNGQAVGFAELLAGRPIDYDGISGPLDFDVDTGEAPADIDVWCVQPGGGGFVASGEFYDATQEVVVGSRTACEPELNSN